jgi:hypothetical protein
MGSNISNRTNGNADANPNSYRNSNSSIRHANTSANGNAHTNANSNSNTGWANGDSNTGTIGNSNTNRCSDIHPNTDTKSNGGSCIQIYISNIDWCHIL